MNHSHKLIDHLVISIAAQFFILLSFIRNTLVEPSATKKVIRVASLITLSDLLVCFQLPEKKPVALLPQKKPAFRRAQHTGNTRMFQGWRRLTLEQRKVWTIIGSGVVVVGAAKVSFCGCSIFNILAKVFPEKRSPHLHSCSLCRRATIYLKGWLLLLFQKLAGNASRSKT